MRNQATGAVLELARRDARVLALTADNRNENYEAILAERPAQYLDYGIAEANMIASAAGLASCGKIPFLYTIGNFMAMRAYEFIRNDVCVPGLNVKFLGRSVGLVSSSMGPSHQGTEDLALLRGLPNLLTITPASPLEAGAAVHYAYAHEGPVYLRLEGQNEQELYDPGHYVFQPGRGVVLREGVDATVISMGSIAGEALRAAEELRTEIGLDIGLINIHTARPIDRDIIARAARETGAILTLEEHSLYGGLGSAVAEVLAEDGLRTAFKMMGLPGFGRGCGNRDHIRRANGLSAVHIKNELQNLVGRRER